MGLTLTIFLGICAIVIDQGFWYDRKGDMQKAADAAVMAGASKLAQATASNSTAAASAASAAALDYSSQNGFTNGSSSVVVTASTDFAAQTFTVTISSPAQVFFGKVLFNKNVTLQTKAVALYTYTTSGLLSITGQNYGLNTGPVNIGLYGPNQITARGDRYSVKYKTTGSVTSLNPDYKPDGYNFQVSIPSNFTTNAIVQLYDPDSYDSGADTTAGSKVWDEGGKDVYGPSGGGYGKTGSNQETFTKYTLFSDNATPYDTTDDTQLQTVTIGADSAKDKKWNNTFTFNPTSLRASNPNINFRMNAVTTSGSNENGFNIRVARPTDTDATFSGGGNGTDVSAIQSMPVNFGVGGTGNVVLGYVPYGATKVTVNHFDSDVGVTTGDYIDYTYKNGSTTSGIYNASPLLGAGADDKVETDVINLDRNYPGGTWSAAYSAGATDNTTWDLTYDGVPTGQPGTIRLIS